MKWYSFREKLSTSVSYNLGHFRRHAKTRDTYTQHVHTLYSVLHINIQHRFLHDFVTYAPMRDQIFVIYFRSMMYECNVKSILSDQFSASVIL